MGQWVITIQGTGAHHNKDYPADADKMSLKFVDELQKAGHVIESATFTYGARQEIKPVQHDAGVPLDT